MQVWNVLHAVCGKYSTQKIAKISPSGHHRTTSLPVSSQLRHVSTIRKKLVKHQFCFTCLHNMANFGPLTAEIGLPVSGTPANFNFFVSRLHYCSNVAHQRGGQPNFARSLAVSWAGTLYIHFRGLLPPPPLRWNYAWCKIDCTPKSCVLLYLQCYCTALQQWTSAKLCGVVQGMKLLNICRGYHLYLAGRPSRWASAHILVKDIVQYLQIYGFVSECFSGTGCPGSSCIKGH